MASKDMIKLVIALVTIGAAVALFVLRTRDDASHDDSVSHWYCTKSGKFFELSGDENFEKVRTARRPPPKATGGEEGPTAAALEFVTVSLSPFTNDWTGVPAIKCGSCGNVYSTDPNSKKENLCPKCQWNPATGKVGPSEPAPAEEDSTDS
jgi:hypothetical protein